jgi:hypothetical protein
VRAIIRNAAEGFVTASGAATAEVYGDFLHLESVWKTY